MTDMLKTGTYRCHTSTVLGTDDVDASVPLEDLLTDEEQVAFYHALTQCEHDCQGLGLGDSEIVATVFAKMCEAPGSFVVTIDGESDPIKVHVDFEWDSPEDRSKAIRIVEGEDNV